MDHTNSLPLFRVTATGGIDLGGVDLSGSARAWRLESSVGGATVLTIDLAVEVDLGCPVDRVQVVSDAAAGMTPADWDKLIASRAGFSVSPGEVVHEHLSR